MRRIFVLIALCFTLMGCSVTTDEETKAIEAGDKKVATTKTTIEEQVLLDENGIRITAIEYEYNSIWGERIKVLVENNTDKEVTVNTKAVIVNDYMVSDLFYCNLEPGKKEYEYIDLYASQLEASGIKNVGQVEIYFKAYGSNSYNDVVVDSAYALIKTSAFDTMDTSVDESGAVLYEGNGVKIIGKYVDEKSFWGASVLLYIENNSGQNINVYVGDMSINGFMMNPIFSSTVYDGRKTVDNITLLSSDLEKQGITSIENIELKFRVSNPDTYEKIFETDNITFNAK